MSPQTKLLILAAAITVLAAWLGWWIIKPPREVIGEEVDPPSKDTNHKHDVGSWS